MQVAGFLHSGFSGLRIMKTVNLAVAVAMGLQKILHKVHAETNCSSFSCTTAYNNNVVIIIMIFFGFNFLNLKNVSFKSVLFIRGSAEPKSSSFITRKRNSHLLKNKVDWWHLNVSLLDAHGV